MSRPISLRDSSSGHGSRVAIEVFKRVGDARFRKVRPEEHSLVEAPCDESDIFFDARAGVVMKRVGKIEKHVFPRASHVPGIEDSVASRMGENESMIRIAIRPSGHRLVRENVVRLSPSSGEATENHRHSECHGVAHRLQDPGRVEAKAAEAGVELDADEAALSG